MNPKLTGLLLIGFLAILAGKASASYTPVGLTERYSAPAVDSEPTNIYQAEGMK